MVSGTSPTTSHIRVAHELGVKYFEVRFWPKGACQGATSVARDDHPLSQSLIEAVGALITNIWHR